MVEWGEASGVFYDRKGKENTEISAISGNFGFTNLVSGDMISFRMYEISELRGSDE